MDPLAAVGLASNIIQFIDFSSKLFITVKELHQNDQTASNTELQDLADKLILACQNLVDVPPNGQGSSRPTPQIPPALNADITELAKTCSKTAKELRTKLLRLRVPPGQRTSFEALKRGLKVMWKKSDIEDMSKRLERYQNQLALSILVQLRESIAINRDGMGQVLSLAQQALDANNTAAGTSVATLIKLNGIQEQVADLSCRLGNLQVDVSDGFNSVVRRVEAGNSTSDRQMQALARSQGEGFVESRQYQEIQFSSLSNQQATNQEEVRLRFADQARQLEAISHHALQLSARSRRGELNRVQVQNGHLTSFLTQETTSIDAAVKNMMNFAESAISDYFARYRRLLTAPALQSVVAESEVEAITYLRKPTSFSLVDTGRNKRRAAMTSATSVHPIPFGSLLLSVSKREQSPRPPCGCGWIALKAIISIIPSAEMSARVQGFALEYDYSTDVRGSPRLTIPISTFDILPENDFLATIIASNPYNRVRGDGQSEKLTMEDVVAHAVASEIVSSRSYSPLDQITEGRNLFHLAALYGHFTCCKLMLNVCMGSLKAIRTERGVTAFHFAISHIMSMILSDEYPDPTAAYIHDAVSLFWHDELESPDLTAKVILHAIIAEKQDNWTVEQYNLSRPLFQLLFDHLSKVDFENWDDQALMDLWTLGMTYRGSQRALLAVFEDILKAIRRPGEPLHELWHLLTPQNLRGLFETLHPHAMFDKVTESAFLRQARAWAGDISICFISSGVDIYAWVDGYPVVQAFGVVDFAGIWLRVVEKSGISVDEYRTESEYIERAWNRRQQEMNARKEEDRKRKEELRQYLQQSERRKVEDERQRLEKMRFMEEDIEDDEFDQRQAEIEQRWREESKRRNEEDRQRVEAKERCELEDMRRLREDRAWERELKRVRASARKTTCSNYS